MKLTVFYAITAVLLGVMGVAMATNAISFDAPQSVTASVDN